MFVQKLALSLAQQTVLHVVVGDVLFQSESASALDRGLPWLFGKPWSQHDLRTDVVGQALVGASSGSAGGPYRYELAADIRRYLLFFMQRHNSVCYAD